MTAAGTKASREQAVMKRKTVWVGATVAMAPPTRGPTMMLTLVATVMPELMRLSSSTRSVRYAG